jgi:hypothetical protein
VALAIDVNVYTNEADATIGGNAVIDAGGKFTDNASVTYPLLFALTPAAFTGLFTSNAVGAVTGLLDGTLGLSSNALNDWVVTQASSENASGNSYSGIGSIAINVYDNTSHAEVLSGAKIDQNASFQTNAQAVAITVQIIDMAGIGKWSLNDGAILSPILDGKLASLKSGDNYVNLYGSAGTRRLAARSW